MPKAETKPKPIRTKRKLNSAIAGGALLSRRDVMARWGMSYRTVLKREKEGLLTPLYLGGYQVVRYRLTDIERTEAAAKGAK